jgi:hypothetical protein
VRAWKGALKVSTWCRQLIQPLQKRTEGSQALSGVRVPHGGLVIFSSSEYQISIGVELDGCDGSLVSLEQDRLLTKEKQRYKLCFGAKASKFPLQIES